MKKEDMKRLCSDGTAVLRIVLKNTALQTVTNILILFALVLIPFSYTYPQIPINGFCKYNSFVTDADFTGLFTANFNKDSYTDIILFNPLRKKMLAMKGNQAGNFDQARTFNLPAEITSISNMTGRDNRITGFILCSRKSRTAQLFDFQNDGRIKSSASIKFSSYPDNISSADVNGNGLNEFIVSGSAFDGISLLSQNSTHFKEEKIAARTSYSNAQFSDLSHDGYPDIAAANVYSRTIDFFYNNSAGTFRKVRSIPSNGIVTYLQVTDINLDNFEDIIYSTDKGITIIYGNAVSSFNKSITISTSLEPDKIITGDYNKDGRIDLVYLNKKNEIISVVFAKDDSSFYPETYYMQKKGISDIIPWYSKYINGIMAISTEGYLYTITGIPSFSSETNISLGIKPSAIASFDNENNGITDFCYIDNFDTKIKFVLRNTAGIPYQYFSFPLYENHSDIIVYDDDPEVKTFYCFSAGKKLIEVVTVNFGKSLFSRQSIYSPGSICELKVTKDDDNTRIYAAYIKNKQLGMTVFTYHNFRFTSTDYPGIANNTASVNISLNTTPALYYWQFESNRINLSKYSPETRTSAEVVNASIPGGAIRQITSFTGDLLNDQKDVCIAFFNGEKDDHIIIAGSGMTRILNAEKIGRDFEIPLKKELYFGETRFNGLKKLVFYNPVGNYAGRIDFINQGRNFISSKIADIRNAGGFFVRNMSYKKYHIVYTDQSENCITVKEI